MINACLYITSQTFVEFHFCTIWDLAEGKNYVRQLPHYSYDFLKENCSQKISYIKILSHIFK